MNPLPNIFHVNFDSSTEHIFLYYILRHCIFLIETVKLWLNEKLIKTIAISVIARADNLLQSDDKRSLVRREISPGIYSNVKSKLLKSPRSICVTSRNSSPSSRKCNFSDTQMWFSERNIPASRFYDLRYGKPRYLNLMPELDKSTRQALLGWLIRTTNRSGNYARVSQKFPHKSFGRSYISWPGESVQSA